MKLNLTITSGSLAGQEFELEHGFLTIGRSENCSVRFDPRGERTASKQHAFIEAKPDGYYITDNQSTNGTLVNGERVQKAKLHSGDEVQFGKNGVTANIRIDEFAATNGHADFHQAQLQSYEQAAQYRPDNLQNSMSNIGLGRLEARPEPSRVGRYLGIGFAILVMVFLALCVTGIMFFSLGPIAAVIAAVVAFTPAMLYLVPFVFLDRYDPEPFWLLALAFAWGALAAVVFSFLLNTFFGAVVVLAVSPDAGQAAAAVISAPFVEEGSKGIGLLILLIFFRRYFDDVLDGIVFAGMIALGFSTVENVLYYGQALIGGGFPALAVIFVMRGILSPFAHVTFTSMTGIGCGIARESHNRLIRYIMPAVGYFGAVTLHMIWNGMAVIGGLKSFIVGYFLLEIPFFLIFVGFAFWVMHRQNKILREMLAIDVARGLIPKEHEQKATSAFRSSGWLLGGIFSGRFRARSRYLRAMGKLGLSYWHIQRATAAQGQTGSFQQNPLLRDEVLKWRDKV